MQKQVQIDRNLFVDILKYFNDENNCKSLEAMLIKEKLNEKFNKIINHILYDRYKRATTPQERQQALTEYLNNKQ